MTLAQNRRHGIDWRNPGVCLPPLQRMRNAAIRWRPSTAAAGFPRRSAGSTFSVWRLRADGSRSSMLRRGECDRCRFEPVNAPAGRA